jgi:hypothetical protein
MWYDIITEDWDNSIHFTLKMKGARSYETMVSYHITTRGHNLEKLELKVLKTLVT